MYRVLYLILFCCISSYVFACDVTDDTGKTIHLTQPAQRIISLAPDITETLFFIGAGQHVVGVVSGSDYPVAARQVSQVGSYAGLDLERIISLHPDLIVTWSHTFSRQLAALKKFDIAVYTTEPHNLDDIPRTMKNLGCLTGTENNANQKARYFAARLAVLRQQYHTQKPVKVFYQIGSYSLMTINHDSWINQVITLCGGRNIFADAKSITPEVGWEAVVAANPEVILTDATNADWKMRWQRWPGITAVNKHLLFSIPPDVIDRAGPRLLEGASQICHYLHPAPI